MNKIIPANQIKNNSFNTALFEEWQTWINDRAEITKQGYTVCIKCFFEWLQDNAITQPTREDIIVYRQWLTQPHRSHRTGKTITFTATTAARYFRGLKMFFAWTSNRGYYPNICEAVRSPKTDTREFKRDPFTIEEYETILQSIDRTTEAGKRDYAILQLSVCCALRIIEMQRANIADIEIKGGETVLFIQGKGHLEKDDWRDIDRRVIEAIEDYLKTYRPDATKEEPLFVSIGSNAKKGGERLTEPAISRIIKNRIKGAGYDSRRLTAHSLRHSSITWLRQSGATLEEAQMHARHTNITTTQIYDHSINKNKLHSGRRVMNFINGNEDEINTKEEVMRLLSGLSEDKAQKALEYMKILAM